MWGREKIGKTVEEVADHLRIVDHIKAIQQAQKEMAAAINAVNERLTAMEAEFRVLKAETQRDALREVQQAVNAVQGAFNDKLNSLATKIAIMEHDQQMEARSGGGSQLGIPSHLIRASDVPAAE
ncbi:hypothetical protein AB7645_05465 [Bradyrhizobium sp. 956_D2_N1_5]|uniref:hypothetical protein n=1 Tax=unclassified Bradyrhizobium TaxID=2631580 RepID=UPI003F20A8EC